jgi:tetratricopeptide (TPR) repeat protein
LAANHKGSKKGANSMKRRPPPHRLILWVPLLGLGVAVSGAQYASGQDVSHGDLSGRCLKFNRTVLDQVAAGRLAEAESALSGALGSPENGLGQSCTWVLLHNMAVVVNGSGRFAEAEVFIERSLKNLAKDYPPEDPVLLRPLQVLASVRFEQRKLGKFREAYQRMLLVRIERPEDRVLIHGVAAAVLHAEGRYREAESEYLTALSGQEASGRGGTADAAGMLTMLGNVYIDEGRFMEAGRALDRALAIYDAGKYKELMNRIKLHNSRALLNVRQRQWRMAEEELRTAISTADGDPQLATLALDGLLADYAYVLRKNHKSREARSIEVRAAALPHHGLTNAVVDASELLAKPQTIPPAP